MIIKGTSEAHLHRALVLLNLDYDDNMCFDREPGSLNNKRTRFKFRLRVRSAARRKDGTYPAGCKVKNNNYGDDGRRGVATACWHASRDFYKIIFEQNPNAKITTSMAVYNGIDDFESKYRDTGLRNVGSAFCPEYMAQTCECWNK